MEPTYKIVRFHQSEKLGPIVMQEGLTLEEAREHCCHPDSDHRGKSREAQAYTLAHGPWFDGYEEE